MVFVGTFSAGEQDIRVEDGRLRIVRDDAARKFVHTVEHRSFACRLAAGRGQKMLYVTERRVFLLHEVGLELMEVGPGVDIERDILARMDFRPLLREPAPMPAALFAEAPIGLRERLAPA